MILAQQRTSCLTAEALAAFKPARASNEPQKWTPEVIDEVNATFAAIDLTSKLIERLLTAEQRAMYTLPELCRLLERRLIPQHSEPQDRSSQ